MDKVQITYQFDSNAADVLEKADKALDQVGEGLRDFKGDADSALKSLLGFNLAVEAIGRLGTALDDLNAPGISLNSSMADLAAITGLTDDKLNAIERSARSSAKAFGTDAAQNVESYKLLLSQLSPELGNNAKALKAMGDNVNILSEQMGGNTIAAAETLTTAMNQYGVSLDDPIAASGVMADMMNVMAAAAREGSAELPQIQEALKQTGMMAKTLNVSFGETNAAIQVLDKAGKKGAEGGVALRNVMSALARGRFLPKQVKQELTSAGVNVRQLTNESLSLTDRLRGLGKVSNDTALMTKIFGKENVAAAIALTSQLDEVDNLTGAITGTNTAVEQADVVMKSYGERMKRQKAWFDDLKVSIFKATEPIMPFVSGIVKVVSTVGQAGYVLAGFNSLMSMVAKRRAAHAAVTAVDTAAVRNNTRELRRNSPAAAAVGIANGLASIAVGAFAGTMKIATAAAKGLSRAIYSIPIIGWILLGVSLIIEGIILLWNKCRGFRKFLFGTWEAIKAIVHNIGVWFKGIWEEGLKPLFSQLWDGAKFLFGGIYNTVIKVFGKIWGAIKWTFTTAKAGAVWIYEGVRDAMIKVWSVMVKVGGFIWDILKSTWRAFSTVFGAVGRFVKKWIFDPIANVFSGVYEFIKKIVNKIWDKVKNLFAPIIKIWNAIFGKREGYIDVGVAYNDGAKKGGEHFDASQKGEDDDTNADLPDMKKLTAQILGGGVGDNGGGDTGADGSGSGRGKNVTININKFVESLNITVSRIDESAERIKQLVTEALMTAVNDVNAAY